jgi:hypothetical protein
MSSFFEELNDLVAETSAGKVIMVTLAILFVSGAVALGFAYWITHRH